jgi:hypothetical protein
MELSNIKDLLGKYQRYFTDKDEENKKIRAVIATVSGITLTEKEITVARGVLVITGNSVLKNELFLYTARILQALKESGITHISEIR